MKWFYSTIFLILPLVLFSQTKEELQSQRERLINQINKTNTLIAQNDQSTQAKLTDIGLLTKKQKQLNQLIQTITIELNTVNKSINKTEETIRINEAQLNQLKSSYSKNMVTAYKQKKQINPLAFVLTSSSMQQAFRRLDYINRVNKHHRQQGNEITEKMALLEKQKESLLAQQQDKKELLTSQQSNLDEIKANQAKIEMAVINLREQGDQLTATLQKQERQRDNLDAQIRSIIAQEIAAAKAAEEAKAKEEARKAQESAANQPKEVEPTPNTQETPVAKSKPENVAKAPVSTAKLSNAFQQNKGKLPWPSEYGVIVSSMGEYGISDLPGIKKERDGVEIRMKLNDDVRTVFDGQVRSVTTIAGFNKVVIISHGEYFTVYGRLSRVDVVVGDELKTGDMIGVVEDNNGTSELHFQIWKGQIKQNPKLWLLKR